MANGEYECALLEHIIYRDGQKFRTALFVKPLVLPFVPWVGLEITDKSDPEGCTVYKVIWNAEMQRFDLVVTYPSPQPVIADDLAAEEKFLESFGWMREL